MSNAVMRLTLAIFGTGLLLPLVAQAAPGLASGKAAFQQKCSACHSDVAGKNGVGPSLFGVYGRAAATAPGYTYSAALKASGLTWTPANLSAWLDKPSALVPRNKMGVAPLLKLDEKANLIAYLKSAH